MGTEAGRPEPATIRDATPDDIPAVRAILASHGNDDPAGQLRGPDIVGPYLRHLLAHHRAMVSETTGREVVAFGAVVDAARSWHLADLFVRTDRLGQGLGRSLLTALYGDRWPRTTFASDDPRALPSYVRAGMAARWVALYLRGGPEAASRAGESPLARRLGFGAAGVTELAELERAWTGADRLVDHGFCASLPGVDPFVLLDADGPVAIAYGRDRQSGPGVRAVDRLVVRPGAEPIGPVLAAVGRAIARGTAVEVMIPGPHPALPVLLELGFRIEDRDIYCAGPTDPVDPERRLLNGGLL